MDTENPYSAPSNSDQTPAVDSNDRGNSLGSIAKRTFLAWEKLRLIYVGILVFETIVNGLISRPMILRTPEFWVMAVAGALFANTCFFVGPIIETYVSWLGYPSKALRLVMFVTGTLFSCALVVISLRYLIVQLSLAGVN